MTLARDWADWSSPVVPGLFQLTGSGFTAVSVAGTAVALRASTSCQVIVLKADKDNADVVYLGPSTVTNDQAPTTGGLQLSPGDFLALSETDLAHVYINGAAGDGVSYAWW